MNNFLSTPTEVDDRGLKSLGFTRQPGSINRHSPLAKKLRELKTSGVTYTQLGHKLDVHGSSISLWSKGKGPKNPEEIYNKVKDLTPKDFRKPRKDKGKPRNPKAKTNNVSIYEEIITSNLNDKLKVKFIEMLASK